MRPRYNLQRDLFEEDRKTTDIPAAQKCDLVRLIEGLLVEALTAVRGKSASRRSRDEGGRA